MVDRIRRFSRSLRSFIDHPLTNLAKGGVLLAIGLSEASRSFRDDFMHRQLRVGHGLIVIGAFSILQALPALLDWLDASQKFLESRESGD